MWQPESFGAAIAGSVVFGLLGILLTVVGYKVFDWLTPGIKVEQELAERQNVAVGIVVAAIIIGASIVVAAVVG
jgi:uncharacterized membrane protein YjfL (UPF0719 family)